MNTEETYLHALSTIPGIGIKRLSSLYENKKSYKKIWESNPDEWASSLRVDPIKIKTYINENPIEFIENKIKQSGHAYITHQNSKYPELLRQIADPPLVLYYEGNLEILQTLCLGVVGSREPTMYGKQVTKKIISEILNSEITIVSGFQRGIDTVAHETALSTKLNTIAVLGTGVDVPYPASNSSLKKRILQNESLLISEYFPGTQATSANFPRRNRIISGLSRGILVTEASYKSGSLITAKCALDQNRDVLAVPGSIYSSLSEGPHYLIKQGAQAVTSGEDILTQWGLNQQQKNSISYELSPVQLKILDILTKDPSSVDELVTKTSLESKEIAEILGELELLGIIGNVGDQKFGKIVN